MVSYGVDPEVTDGRSGETVEIQCFLDRTYPKEQALASLGIIAMPVRNDFGGHDMTIKKTMLSAALVLSLAASSVHAGVKVPRTGGDSGGDGDVWALVLVLGILTWALVSTGSAAAGGGGTVSSKGSGGSDDRPKGKSLMKF